MNRQYRPFDIETKWLKRWLDANIYAASDTSSKQKSYILVEFPYPSGERLHVGHARSYCALDAVARLRRMKGYEVLYPMGWDAFGLPAENYSIKTGIHPEITVKENIENAKKQLMSWGLSFDWSREVNTTDSKYYKWTQWIFLQMYKDGLAYRAEIPVNWCPSCKINLANEEVVDGCCERCGAKTERRMQKQWLLKITKYAQRLLDDLESVNYRSDIKKQQQNWIGRKEGVNITYPIIGMNENIVCFTTKPETNFGASFIVLSPEHPLVRKVVTNKYSEQISQYSSNSMKKGELERIRYGKKKTGIFTGRYALNRLNGNKLPIYVSDFVLSGVGTGALVGVPGHDRRDFEFASEFKLPVIKVVDENDSIINSDFLNGFSSNVAGEKISNFLEDRGWGERAVDFHLRDWVFSRQHYWGEPIPVIYCDKCGEVPVPEEYLPVKLPHVENYVPSNTGESPLAKIPEWVNISCPVCGSHAKRETDTMPNWAGSSWYFLRYIDPNNDKVFADRKLLEKWLPVDWYNGGMEHTTLHLLYSRFWYKFLFDKGLVPTSEPYAVRTSHGVVLGTDGFKMSKSKGNVINPDEIVRKYGADSLRLYLMFIGPFEHSVAWSDDSISGVRRFLNKVYELSYYIIESKKMFSDKSVLNSLVRLKNKVESDIESKDFNTVVSSMMETVNVLSKKRDILGRDAVRLLALILAPCAPYIAEEIWESLGEKFSVHSQPWPVESGTETSDVSDVVVQVKGKVKAKISIKISKLSDEAHVVEKAISALNMRGISSVNGGSSYIYARNKIVNFR